MRFSLILSLLAITYCTQALGFPFGLIDSAVQRMQSSSGAAVGNQQTFGSLPITSDQKDKIDQAIHTVEVDSASQTAIAEATPVMVDFIRLSSCVYDKSSSMRLQADATLDSNVTSLLPMLSGPVFHNKFKCLSVKNIQNWTMPDTQTLRFSVTYLADDSSETVDFNYKMEKQSDGKWLFKEAFF